jgi:hypothetical protein
LSCAVATRVACSISLGLAKLCEAEGIAAEEPPPPLRARFSQQAKVGNEDVVDTWMSFQPGTGLEAEMTTEIVGNDEEVALGIVGFDVGQKRDVALRRCVRGQKPGQLLTIAHA